jgi:hypothetical protein
MSYDTNACTEKCWAMPQCAVCGMPKKPHGRDAGPAANGLCDYECPGYTLEPISGHLWNKDDDDGTCE